MDTYEKKYNEALERARKIREDILNNEIIGFPGQITDIFPELRESESDDERIRKGLIKLLTVASEAYLVESTGIKKDSYLSYLKKQKEQKPVEWTELTWKDIVELEGIINNVHYDFSAGIGQESFGKEVLERFRNKKDDAKVDACEQKPNIELIQRSWYMEGYHDRDFFMEPKWILKTGEGGPKYEPNPKYGKSLILGPEPCCCSVNGHKAGLKDAEMQKPAWSEEDERMLNNIICILQKYITRTLPTRPNSCNSYDDAFYTHQTEINWLKSLRPSWKPSEEQMDALQHAIDACESEWDYQDDELRSLLNDIKKL